MTKTNLQLADESLTREIEQARERVHELEAARHALRLQAAPIKAGELVRCHRGRGNDPRGNLFRVAEVVITSYTKIGEKPWVMGSPLKKDGTFSATTQHLFSDWIGPVEE